MKSLKVFWELACTYPKLLAKCAVWLLIDAVFAVFSVVTVVPLADLVLQREPDEWLGPTKTIATVAQWAGIPFNLLSVAILIALSMLALAVIGTVVRWVTQTVRQDVTWSLTEQFFSTMYGAGWEYFSNSKSGYLINTIINELRLVGSGLFLLAGSLSIIFRVIAFLLVPFLVSPVLVISCLGACLAVAIPFMMVGKINYKFGNASAKAANKFSEVTKSALDGARETIVFGKRENTLNRLSIHYEDYAGATVKSQTLGFAAPQFFEPFGFLAIAAVLFIFSDFQSLNLAEVGVVLWGLMRAIPPLKQLIQLKHQLDNTLPRLEQAKIQLENAFIFTAGNGDKGVESFNKAIRFEQVSFQYAAANNIAVNKIDLEIPQGKIVALVGESGSGKSTLIDLLVGLLRANNGKIMIDDQEINEVIIDDWRAKIGYVPQSPTLLDLSIRENLKWANDSVTEKEMIEACEISGVNQFIGELSNGLDTTIGESGMRISGGQAQRISMARALVRKPELLILDEATSALDSENEMGIFDGIYENLKGMTILVVAHRLATIVRADTIYVMKHGEVVENGSYQELINNAGYFSKLATLQQL